MLVAVGVIATVLIVATAFALADILEDETLPAPIARAWLAGVTFAPGVGAVLWFSRRQSTRVPVHPMSTEYPSPQDLTRLYEEIDRFRSPSA